MPELPEPEIRAAEEATAEHDHLHVEAHDGSLREHLVRDHGLEVPGHLSATTQEGLHDRVHGETGAADH